MVLLWLACVNLNGLVLETWFDKEPDRTVFFGWPKEIKLDDPGHGTTWFVIVVILFTT